MTSKELMTENQNFRTEESFISPKKLYFRFGIATKISIGLFFIASFAILSAFYGFFSFSKVQTAFNSVSQEHLPFLQKTAEIAQQSQILVSITPEYLNAHTLEEHKNTRKNMLRITQELKRSIDEISKFDYPDPIINDLQLKISLITSNIEKFDSLIITSLQYRERLDQLRKDLIDFNEEINVAKMEDLGGLGNIPLQRWMDVFQRSLVGTVAALTILDSQELDLVESRTLERIADLQSDLQNIEFPPKTRDLQTQWLSLLTRYAVGKESVHHTQRLLINLNTKLNEILQSNRHFSTGLGATLGQLTNESADQVSQATDRFQDSLTTSGRLSITILSITILSILLMLIFLFRSVMSRLVSLEKAMQSYIDGKEHPIPDHGHDEIASMGKALGIFIKRIQEREYALKTSESRLTAQNNALRALSRSSAINSGRFKESLKEVAETVATTLSARRVCIWLAADGRLDRFELAYAYDPLFPENSLPTEDDLLKSSYSVINLVDHPHYFEALGESDTLAVPRIEKDPLLAEFAPAYWQQFQITSLINATIRVRGVLFGFVSIEDDTKDCEEPGCRHWAADEISFSAAMAGMIERCLLDQERRRAETDLIAANHESKEQGEALNKTQTLLESSERMATLGVLVGSVAHEVNTPIGIILTASSHLNSKTQQFQAHLAQDSIRRSDMLRYLEAVAEAGQLIAANSSRAGELIQSLKHVSTEQTTNRRNHFDLYEELNKIAFTLKPLFSKTPHKMTIDGPKAVFMNSYPGALAQITTNIVTNALKHAFSAEKAGLIEIDFTLIAAPHPLEKTPKHDTAADPSQSWVRLTYQDNGCGMSEEYLTKVFEPYVTSKPNDGGTGLGLYIVKKLVTEELKGLLKVESHLGTGTVFSLELPLSPEDNDG